MKKFLRKLVYRYLPILMAINTVFFLIFFIYTLSNCKGYFEEESTKIADNLITEQANSLGTDLADVRNGLYSVIKKYDEISVERAEWLTDSEHQALDAYSATLSEQLHADYIRLVAGTHVVYEYGETKTNLLSDELLAHCEDSVITYTPAYYDASIGSNCVALYYPIALYDEVTSVILYFKEDHFLNASLPENDPSLLSCTAQADGAIISLDTTDKLPEDVSHNIITYLYNISTSKDEIDALKLAMSNGMGSGVTKLTVKGEPYLCAYSFISDWGNRCYILHLYDEKELLDARHDLYSELFACAVILAVIVILLLVLLLTGKREIKTDLKDLDDVDAVVGGNSAGYFKRQANNLLNTNQFTRFAFIYISVNNYDYFKENFSDEQTNHMLRFLVTVFEKSIVLNETYGHLQDDKFAMLIHFTNPTEIVKRVRVMSTLVNNYEDLQKLKTTLKLDIGIFANPTGSRFSLQDMMDRAVIAHQDNQKHSDLPFSIFDSSIQNTHIREAEIEAKQEFALKNHDFKLFFQPMYNIHEDRIEGAEILVRWYDSKTNQYISPADFVPLFEINGFINRMDRFVFEEVCSYMNQASRRGDKITHCNVNVSHVTASQPDFVDFYVGKKREYGIPNDYLTIEFSESFAFKNYDAMKTAVNGLRQGGIGCTIDDFGSAFTSYHVLKELPMTELKLHRFFIWEKGNEEHDRKLLNATIQLGKACGLKVIQGGVETKEQMDMVGEMGCDVIQGFYYAKPMLMSDFIDFVNRGTDLKNVLAHQ